MNMNIIIININITIMIMITSSQRETHQTNKQPKTETQPFHDL